MKPINWNARQPSGTRMTAGIFRGICIGMVVIGLMGCSISQFVSSAAPTVAQPSVVTPVMVPEQATQAPLPTYTPFPTYTLLPTYTSAPAASAIPTNTLIPPTATLIPPLPPAQVVVVVTATSPASVYNPSPRGCCTLRVRNQGKRTYWIGTYLPYGGNYIKPRWYIEFYTSQPQWLRVYWCRYDLSYKNDLYGCEYQDFKTEEGLKEVLIP